MVQVMVSYPVEHLVNLLRDGEAKGRSVSAPGSQPEPVAAIFQGIVHQVAENPQQGQPIRLDLYHSVRLKPTDLADSQR